MSGRLAEFQDTVAGYYRVGEEDQFPWGSTGKAVWYALLVVEDGKIQRYGFTPAAGQKTRLLSALRALKSEEEALLLGIWKGEYRADAFVLEVGKAKAALAKL